MQSLALNLPRSRNSSNPLSQATALPELKDVTIQRAWPRILLPPSKFTCRGYIVSMHSTFHSQEKSSQQAGPAELPGNCQAPSTTDASRSVSQLEASSRLEGPRNVLRQILSTHEEHILSAEATTLKEDTRALPSQYLRAIGWGSCGTMYHQLGTSHVIKKAINGNIALSDECRLWNDLVMHKKVEEIMNSHSASRDTITVLVPRVHRYISKADESWNTHDHMFPPEDRTTEHLLISEYIPPIDVIGRNALIDYFCPEKLRPAAKLQDSNNDCLVRLYLGKRRDHITRLRPGPKTYFGIRNFPLCLDQMEAIGLDTKAFASAMADTLAILHWEARIDAADIEFVLGGAPCLTHKPLPKLEHLRHLAADTSTDTTTPNPGTGAPVTHLWLLDFNQCQPIAMNEGGADQAVRRFLDNDPYYPRPATGSADDSLWLHFQQRYITASRKITNGSGHSDLPSLFIES